MTPQLKQIRFIVSTALLLSCALVFGQEPAGGGGAPSSPSTLAEVETLAKILGAFFAGMATLVGLPVVFLTYRKTRAEITKLELEANALRSQHSSQAATERDVEGNITITVDRSPETRIEVLADPRFLAPLLILLDFIFAWILLTLAGYLLSIFGNNIFRTFALAALAAVLLLPIAHQVLRVRAVLQTPRTPEEILASQRQVRIAVYSFYFILVLFLVLFGGLLLNESYLSGFERYVAWFLIAFGTLLGILAPLVRRRFDRYLTSLRSVVGR